MSYTLNNVKRGLGDLLNSAEFDIKPIIQPNTPEGGYFGVVRSVLCYIDYLGALYEGYDGRSKFGNGTQKLATPEKAKKFIKEILGVVDESYKLNGELLYEMYRHGTVHLYRPHRLKNSNGRVLFWLTYKGSREYWTHYEHKAIKVRHLQILKWKNKEYALPVSIICLYEDLIESVQLYFEKIENELKNGTNHLLNNYSTMVEALMKPEPTKLSW